MSEQQINAVGRVDRDVSSRLVQMAQAQEIAQRQVPARKSEATKQEDQILDQVSEALNQKLSPMNTGLKFQIDDETDEIIVLIVDRATDKVLHTIPAEAIRNLPAGKLMQYFA